MPNQSSPDALLTGAQSRPKLENPALATLADSLWEARVHARPRPPLRSSRPELTVEEAYQISRANSLRRIEAGEKLVGHKIGLTSRAVQGQFGVNQPDFGFLTSAMAIDHDGAIAAGELIQARMEGEVAFVLGRDLRGPGITPEQALEATDHVVACIEIIDSRIENWKITIEETIADNASSSHFVLGTRPRRPRDLDLRLAGMVLRKNGEVESTGVGAACLDHPANAVAWLANALGARGETLKAGELILSGAYGPVVPFGPGDRCEVEIRGLGAVSCRVEPELRSGSRVIEGGK